eukprot:4005585-Prymnesium_polylepis.2
MADIRLVIGSDMAACGCTELERHAEAECEITEGWRTWCGLQNPRGGGACGGALRIVVDRRQRRSWSTL